MSTLGRTFFDVKVIAMNSHRLPGKGRRMGPIMGQTMHYRRMIITLQPGMSQFTSSPVFHYSSLAPAALPCLTFLMLKIQFCLQRLKAST
ncbi:hypothetical protein DCAR_0313556 [Daucus carota subsp. sativus]|uniref:50S ribosomal protein L23, chloroplastic n=1 Tax=Daucus carota subsp. sativus TaxID=79200 RepID=A0AAF0WTL7_DAUCS|nr:hypothetical protein DCAR_0313556 [Daucus carota subsp. sativus]